MGATLPYHSSTNSIFCANCFSISFLFSPCQRASNISFAMFACKIFRRLAIYFFEHIDALHSKNLEDFFGTILGSLVGRRPTVFVSCCHISAERNQPMSSVCL